MREAASAKIDMVKRNQQLDQEAKRAAAADSECASLRSRVAALEDSLRAVSFREEQVKKEWDALLSKDAERTKVSQKCVYACMCIR